MCVCKGWPGHDVPVALDVEAAHRVQKKGEWTPLLW